MCHSCHSIKCNQTIQHAAVPETNTGREHAVLPAATAIHLAPAQNQRSLTLLIRSRMAVAAIIAAAAKLKQKITSLSHPATLSGK